jgi:hypothetical protein
MSRTKQIFIAALALCAIAVFGYFPQSPLIAQEAVGKRSDTCIECHEKMGGIYAKLVADFRNSTHWEMGMGCIDCHGGDPTSGDVSVAMSPDNGYIGIPDRAKIIEVCGSCHSNPEYMKKFSNIRTDQVELYKTSIHGKQFFENGDVNVAVCIDCHSSHLITGSANPLSSTNKGNIPKTCGRCHADQELMSQYGISAEVVDDYMAGYHGQLYFEEKEIAAPVCVDCHGTHGAAPPGVDTIHNVCGTCHLRTEQYYAQGAHNEAFKSAGLPKCITCHDNHKLERPTDSLISSTQKGGCMSCHTKDSGANDSIETILASLGAIRDMHSEAEELVETTERVTHLSMLEMEPKVGEIETKLLTARVLQHGADIESITENQNEAAAAFEEIKNFTVKLIERGKRVKRHVLFIGALLFVYGLMMLYYTKVVLANR